MKKHFLWIAFIFSIEAFSDTVEEKLMTGIDLEASHSFLHNPAILDISKKSYSILAVKDTRNSSVLASPDGGTPQNVSYTLNENIVAGSMLVPFGGGAFGLSYIRHNQDLVTDNDVVGDVINETKRDDIYAFKFAINLTPNLDFGFQYQYKQADTHVYGSFFLDDEDKSIYKAFLSSYRLGIKYKGQKFAIAGYTDPPARGKALIDGENKIVAEPGTGGADFVYKISDKTSIGLGVTRWFYRRDDRLELSTSPIDQRNISLNGLDLDQYLAKVENRRLGVSHKLKGNISLLFSASSQESVYHFDENGLPGDDRENIPSFKYMKYQFGGVFKKNRMKIELRWHTASREQSSITDRSFKLGHRDYVNYKANEQGFFLLINFMSG